MLRIILLVSVLFSGAIRSDAQDIKPLKSFELSSEAVTVDVDRLGNFYFLTEHQLIKIDQDGKILAEKTLELDAKKVFIEAWNPLRVLIHQRGNSGHQILLLNPNLEQSEPPIQIDPAFALSPVLVAHGSTSQSYWLLDEDQSVKELDLANQRVIIETEPMRISKSDAVFTQIRLYQNFIFLLEQGYGIHILSRTGKNIKKIEAPRVKNFGVLGEDLYFTLDDEVVFQNLYNGNTYTVSLPEQCERAIATDERILTVSGKSVTISSFSPKK